jgi:broad specificity phosphatase PhoE
VTCRVAAWLDEAVKAYGGRTILAIGHRATFYAFEHLIKGVSLHEAVMSAWRWQPGWMYELTPGLNHASRQRSKVVTN